MTGAPILFQKNNIHIVILYAEECISLEGFLEIFYNLLPIN